MLQTPEPTSVPPDRLPVRFGLRLVTTASMLTGLLLALTSAAGLLSGARGLYRPDPATLPTFLGQDAITLVAVLPLLLTSIWLARRGSVRGLLLWAAGLFYVAYSYSYYVLNPEFNWLYVAYIAIVAMSMYGCLYLLLAMDAKRVAAQFSPSTPVQAPAGFLMVLSVGLGFAWVMMILERLHGDQMPTRIEQVVWPMDLVVAFPAMFWSGLWLWRRQPLGYVVAAILLVKAGLLGVTLVVTTWIATTFWSGATDPMVPVYALAGAGGLTLAAWYLWHVRPPGDIHQSIIRHPVLAYYLLTFALSWGGILFVVGGPGGIPGSAPDLERLMPLAIPFMLFGPTTAAVVMIGYSDGPAGYRQILARLFRWRVDVRWYAFALLTAPIVYTSVLLMLSLVSSEFLPGIVGATDKLSFALVGTAPGLLVGFMEELGWTGFATPRLRLRQGILKTGLSIGVVWGAWHILTNVLWPATVLAHGVPVATYIALSALSILIGQLPAFRVLIVWVYDRTQSLLVAMLMHASLVFSTFVLGPIGIDGVPILIYGFAVGLSMWLVVACVNICTRGALIQRRLPERCPALSTRDGGIRAHRHMSTERRLRRAFELPSRKRDPLPGMGRRS